MKKTILSFLLFLSPLVAMDTSNMTFSMIKPHAVREEHIGDILQKVEREGFHIVALRMRKLSKEEAETFYGEHKGKPFFPQLVDMITSGPLVTMVLEKEGAQPAFRAFIGATDPKKAVPGTIRALFGKDITQNAIHASDSPKSAQREISFFFSEDEIAQTVNPSPK